ncbi:MULTISPECIES: heat-inducible transcriptional repressor HrcA [unclassified Methylophilus]|uniref:heat-inducible transcriptional repressor HrcA n=1 Tax=unclassified Methylophilus TaxID=2630143 RepID=UPI0006FA3288|nr:MULTISPECIES: heat-inducible transcriptional repressor HrcA [unclassified Methylophilus]KQT41652.1 HrcA family transcriptional regulator [Methylophilus sp. Leaf416]KQT55819.1 HrcA family transcriptional regulator [Methylophilus sp. Leaf459]
MDKRAQILLKTLVEHYISAGQPIGSRTLLQHSGLDVSPATIRNVMSDLEQLGFIASPHTSSGRVPTKKGYRLFVDSLMTVQPLDNQSVAQLKTGLSSPNQQELISSAADMLSQLTQFAGLVMTPKRVRNVLKHMEFLHLSEKKILVILVTEDGQVQNRILMAEKTFSASELIAASNYVNSHCQGLTLDELQHKLKQELQQMQADINRLMSAALDAAGQPEQSAKETVVISGERNLLQVDELSTNVTSLRKLFEIFERRTALMQLLDHSQRADGIQIFIGGESGYLPLDECSLITAPYEADGQVVGTLGVIGPTRMAYERIIPIVDITAKLLSNALSNQ